MGDELKVTQVDRDAAAPFVGGGVQSYSARQAYRREVARGEHDKHLIVQAFARHRIATETQSQATIDELVGALKRLRPTLEAIVADKCADIQEGGDPTFSEQENAANDALALLAKAGGQS